MKRASAIESAVLVRGLNHPDDALSGNEQVDVALAQGRVWNEQKKDLNLLTLYENRIQRRIEKNTASPPITNASNPSANRSGGPPKTIPPPPIPTPNPQRAKLATLTPPFGCC